MGVDFSNSELEWAKPKDLKVMDTETQWINLCVMSPEEDSNSIDAMIEDMTDTEAFHGLTTEDDLFDVGEINPINFEEMVCIKTNISLHRQFTWDKIAGELNKQKNSIAVCPIAVYNEEHFLIAQQLMAQKPPTGSQYILPVFVRNAKADDKALDARVAELATQHNGMMVSAKVNDPSAT